MRLRDTLLEEIKQLPADKLTILQDVAVTLLRQSMAAPKAAGNPKGISHLRARAILGKTTSTFGDIVKAERDDRV